MQPEGSHCKATRQAARKVSQENRGAGVYLGMLLTCEYISSAARTTLELLSNARCASIIWPNSVTISTFEFSRYVWFTVPTPLGPPGTSLIGFPEERVAVIRLLPTL